MNRTITLLVCGAALGAAAAGAPQVHGQNLETRVPQVSDGKVAFSFPTRPGVCGDGEFIAIRDEENGDKTSYHGSWSNNRESRLDRCVAGPARVTISRSGGRYRKVDVTVGGRADGVATDLGAVTAEEAVRFLHTVATEAPEKHANHAIFALTIADASTSATTALIALTRPSALDREVRKHAVFWLSQSKEARAYTRLKDILGDESEHVEVRKASIFALSRGPSADAVSTLLGAARSANRMELRKDAIFWLGQLAADKATTGLTSILGDDSEEIEVREAALFALSQQKNDTAVETLINVATSSKEPQLRRTSLFWLGQRGDDPRVLKLFSDILLKN